MEKKCKVVMLPTKGKSNVYLELNIPEGRLITNKLIELYDRKQFRDYIPQYFYILSDDEIEENEEHYTSKWNDIHSHHYRNNEDTCHKIIASTDPSLNLPAIPQSFIEEYVSEYNDASFVSNHGVKGSKIEEVMVEYETLIDEDAFDNVDCLIINPDNILNIKRVKDSFTRDEVIDILKNKLSLTAHHSDKGMDKWIEKNL